MVTAQQDLLPRTQTLSATWREVNKFHPRLVELADHHYTRQKPGTNQAARPGVNLCLLLSDGSAAWIVWRPIPEVGRMDNLEAWECTLFRNEGRRLSSDLIREATDLTFRKWGWPPRDGLITAVGVEQTKRRRSRRNPPGHCYLMAGWAHRADLGGWDLEVGADGARRYVVSDDAKKVWLEAPRPMRVARDLGKEARR